GVFSRAVILQDVWLLTCFAQPLGNCRTERLMDATLQGFRTEANLLEHRGGKFGMNWLATVGGAGKRELLFSKPETIGCARDEQRNRLMGFGRGTQIGNCFRRPEIRRQFSVGFNCNDV